MREVAFTTGLSAIALLVGTAVADSPAGQSSPADGSNSTCGPDAIESYDLKFHISGVFIVLAVSAVGCFGALSLGNYNSHKYVAAALQLFKMFGIGIIAGTAWIHLLPDAFSQFTNPCLKGYWTEYGPNYVGLFGLIAAFAVQQVEVGAFGHTARREARAAALAASAASSESGSDRTIEEAPKPPPANPFLNSKRPAADHALTVESAIPHGHGLPGGDEGDSKGRDLSIILLELGILFHSMIIGITLGVTDDASYSTLLAAICFHQMFEGMAIGTLISKMTVKSVAKYLVFGIAYPLTTPVGIAIGVGTRSYFNGNAETTIVVQGILNSLSAGILFYNTYTELMSMEINHNPTFRGFSGAFKSVCFFAMYLGAAAMAVIGIWA
ncbi:high-affinity Zn(2+) transporter zrt1 [Irineochytrium annulatum]|nr:high-affinity Zn(2+) transporter zrt1 [Irineochytrium annulatum]